MANTKGNESGNGRTSPFGDGAGGTTPITRAGDLIANPCGSGDKGEPHDYIDKPTPVPRGDRPRDLVADPGPRVTLTETSRDPRSIPKGGPTLKADPPASRAKTAGTIGAPLPFKGLR
jgi:hypothetical protein